MHISAIIISALASMALASPQGLSKRGGGGGSGGSSGGSGGSGGGSGDYDPCSSGLYGLAYCCQANVLQVLGVTCSEVSKVPDSPEAYVKDCGANVPSCCAVSAAGLGVLCTTPEGVSS